MVDKDQARQNLKKLLKTRADTGAAEAVRKRADRPFAIERKRLRLEEIEAEKKAAPIRQEAYMRRQAKIKKLGSLQSPGSVFKFVNVHHHEDAEECGCGIPETPALVSPYMGGGIQVCKDCGEEYGSLFYGVGRKTESAHCGPIYTTEDPYSHYSPGRGLLSGILGEGGRDFTGTRAHYLTCAQCHDPSTEGTLTGKGKVLCSDCEPKTPQPISWEIDEGELKFLLNKEYTKDLGDKSVQILNTAIDRLQKRLQSG